MATVLTLAGLGWQDTDIMDSLYQGFAHTGGNTYHRVGYTPQHDGVFANGVANLDAAIEDAGLAFPKIVLGHSLGSQVASAWLRQYGVSKAAHASDVSFILCGNPERRFGGRAGIPIWNCNGAQNRTTPETAFTVKDVCREGDGWANWPAAQNPFNTNGYDLGLCARAFLGMFSVHMLYFDIDLNNLEGTKLDKRVSGNTSYYLMP